ncbi:MAG: molybdenum cofactor biosynthesis protein MoaE, partial [Gammaproteobacteria bacterium]|nr:molybdenum cofactor biosynthesis protein MoaE [Gammaproteobacteria bacterium]
MKVEITETTFNPYEEIEHYQSSQQIQGQYGATATFVGSMRDYNDNQQVSGMMLEHYPGMTEKHIEKICQKAMERWSLLDVLVIHRVGEINIGDAIVTIGVWAAHRGDATDACRHILEDLKSEAPFWKKEHAQA